MATLKYGIKLTTTVDELAYLLENKKNERVWFAPEDGNQISLLYPTKNEIVYCDVRGRPVTDAVINGIKLAGYRTDQLEDINKKMRGRERRLLDVGLEPPARNCSVEDTMDRMSARITQEEEKKAHRKLLSVVHATFFSRLGIKRKSAESNESLELDQSKSPGQSNK